MEGIQQFIDYLQTEKFCSPLTVKAYRKDLMQFVSFYEEITHHSFSSQEISLQNVRQWLSHLVEEKYAPSSVNRKISSLKSYYRYLKQHELVNSKPTDSIGLLKQNKRLPQTVGEQDLNYLLDSVFVESTFENARDHLIVSLLYCTGIRRAELAGIQLGDVDIGSLQLRVKGKGNKQRILPLLPELKGIIQKYLQQRKKVGAITSHLFVTEKGKPIYSQLVYRVVKKYLSFVSTVKKKSPHVLRHSFATHLLNRGASIQVIRELLGHTSLAATEVYTHVTLEKLKETYNRAHPRGDKKD